MNRPAGIYLIIEFDWPAAIEPDLTQKARRLHDSVRGQGWIREVVVASGGIGGGPSSMWVLWLQNYASLDRLFTNDADIISIAYREFFSAVEHVQEKVRHEVQFVV